MTKIYSIEKMSEVELQQITGAIEEGAVIAFATDTVYGLGTNAFAEKSISRIYQIKQRPSSDALQILVGSVAQAQQITQWNEGAELLAKAFWPGALTLILKPNLAGEPLRRGFAGLGLRVPAYAPLLRLLSGMSVPLASTSANLHGQPVLTTEDQVIGFLEGKADCILTGGTLSATASSVVDLTGAPVLLREGAVSRARLEETLRKSLKEL